MWSEGTGRDVVVVWILVSVCAPCRRNADPVTGQLSSARSLSPTARTPEMPRNDEMRMMSVEYENLQRRGMRKDAGILSTKSKVGQEQGNEKLCTHRYGHHFVGMTFPHSICHKSP